MTQQVINIGTAEDDGTGDHNRAAWDKTNQNFSELYGLRYVSNSGTPTVGQYAKWVTAVTIQGVAPATVLSDIGAQPAGNYQPLDGDLTAIAGLTSAADQAPYFTGSGTAALMTITAAARTVLDDTTVGAMLTTLGGLSSATAATTYAPLASPTFTGDPKAPTPATADNDTSIATTAFVQAQGYLTTAAAAAAYQPLDADLTAIAALTGTNTIYYRSAANTWAAVNVSTGLAFSGGNLTATGGGGNVSNSGTPVDNQLAIWTDATHVEGNAKLTFDGAKFKVGDSANAVSTTTHPWAVDVHANVLVDARIGMGVTDWSTSATDGAQLVLMKSKSATVGTVTAVAGGDIIGEFIFRGALASGVFGNAALMRVLVNGTPGAGIPGAVQQYVSNSAGTAVLCASISPGACNFIGDVAGGGGGPTGYIGEYLTASASNVALTSGAYTATAVLSLPAGDWDVRGVVRVTGTAGSYMYINVYPTSGVTSGSADSTQTGIFTGLGDCWTAVGPFRVSRSSTATYYLNIYVATAGCTAVTAEIQARRRH